MIERVALSGQTARPAHHRRAAKLAKVLPHTAGLVRFGRASRQIVQIDFEITGHEKIQSAIAVVIAPGRAGAPTFARDSQLFRHVRKRSISVVMVETRDTNSDYVQ